MDLRHASTSVRLLLSGLLVVALTAATPASSWAVDEVTGDITDPELISFAVTPAAVDVTDSAQSVKITARVTDAGTGVEWVALSTTSPNAPDVSFGTNVELVSGDRFDGVYEGSVVVPEGAAPGSWRLFLSARDGVNNDRTYQAEDLTAGGWPGYIDVTSRDPDLTAPSLVELQVMPSELDVRSGPATSTVRVRLTDAGSGTAAASVHASGPYADTGSGGGVNGAALRLVSGSPADGWWEGAIAVQQYAHAGTWQLAVSTRDQLYNGRTISNAELQERSLPSTLTVTSEEDVVAPAVTGPRLSSLALDVSRADQQLSLEVTVSDELSGVHDYSWGDSAVQFMAQHLGIGQYAQSPPSARLSGDDRRGTYRPTLTIPRSSATGAWLLRASAVDKVGNETWLNSEQLAALGLPASVLVYNTPLPPVDVTVDPADGSAVVQWAPPLDERGAEVTEYIVTESPQGEVVRTTGDELSAVVSNLTNDVEHSFVVQAVNRAGASEASASATAVPTESGAAPSPTATPEHEPPVAPAPPRVDGVTRLAGADRYSTAVAASQASFPSTANDVFVVTGTDWPDALAAGPAAASVSAPVLPVQRHAVPTAVAQELERLQPRRVWVVGGAGVVSDTVLSQLREGTAVVSRLSGSNRYSTAAAVADRFFPNATGAYYASGATYADALGGAAAAARRGWPLLLTSPTAVPTATPRIGVERIVLGGPTAVSETVRANLGARRVAGGDRFSTAAAIARDAWRSAEVGYLATGLNFPDALSGAAAAARDDAPLLLSRHECVPAATRDVFDVLQVRSRVILGGTSAVQDAAAALRVC